MIGNPKYKLNDIVTFDFGEVGIKTGIIFVVDAYGTFFDDSDVSYDIYVQDENRLYKHCKEQYIIEKIGKSEEDVYKLIYEKV